MPTGELSRTGLVLAAGLVLLGSGGTGSATDLNPTGRTVQLAVPVRENGDGPYLGEVVLRITPDDSLAVRAERFLEVIAPIAEETLLARLRAGTDREGWITPAAIEATGLAFAYDPFLLEVRTGIPAEVRRQQEISVIGDRRRPSAPGERPARLAAQLNIAAQTRIVHRSESASEGIEPPTVAIDAAVRAAGVVLETEIDADFDESDYDRRSTRFVYDDPERVLRLIGGDLLPETTGFQSSERIAGVAVLRRYRELQPGRVTRPGGRRSFLLERAADVDLYVNGRLVRRFRLPPGPYDIRDFPLTTGANRVRLEIRDDAGRLEVLEFDLFFDADLLAPGLDEFFLGAGVRAPLDAGEPDYSNEPVFTAFYRRGVTDSFTAEVYAQGDDRVRQLGALPAAATPFGNFALDLAVSDHDDAGLGTAAELDWQYLFGNEKGVSARSLQLSATWRSRDFAALGTDRPSNPFGLELRGSYSRPLPGEIRGSVAATYAFGRDDTDDRWSVDLALSRNIGRLGLSLDASYEQGTGDSGFGVFFRASYRLGARDRAEASYDSRLEEARIAYSRSSPGTLGSLSWTVEARRDPDNTSFSGNLDYRGTRADIGLSHDARMTDLTGGSEEQVTGLRLDTALVFADGAFSLSRRVGNAFAILVPHPTLGDRRILVDPSPDGVRAASDRFGPAVVNDLGAYVPTTITVDVEDLPPGYDLGAGSFDLVPPYRGSYLLTVGSAYNVSALGTMLDAGGKPVALVSGLAFEQGEPARSPVSLFTNRAGRFGIPGLAPGRWRIVMNTTPRLVYEIEIPEKASGLVRLGEIRPVEVEEEPR